MAHYLRHLRGVDDAFTHHGARLGAQNGKHSLADLGASDRALRDPGKPRFFGQQVLDQRIFDRAAATGVALPADAYSRRKQRIS